MKLKRTSKLLAWLLTLVMVVGLLPTMALAGGPYTMSVVSEGATFTDKGISLSSNMEISNGTITIQTSPKKMQYIELQLDGGTITDTYVRQNISEIYVNTTKFQGLSTWDGSDSYVAADNAGINLRLEVRDGKLIFTIERAVSANVSGNITVKIVFASGSGGGGETYSLTTLSESAIKGTVTEPVGTTKVNEYYITATPEPGYAFDKWQYRTYVIENDTTVYTPSTGWADYEDLTEARGSVTVTANTEFQACFVPASIELVALELGAVDEVMTPQWAPIDNSAAADNQDFGGFGVESTQGVIIRQVFDDSKISGTPAPREAAALVFQWAPVGIIQGPNASYYRSHDCWNSFSAETNPMVTFKLYAGGAAEGTPIFEKTTTLWIGGANNDEFCTVGGTDSAGPFYGAVTFLMPENGQLTFSMALNGQTPSVQTLTVYDNAQFTALQNLSSYYTQTFGTNPAGAENLPDETYKKYADVRILLENAYAMGRDNISAAEGADAVTTAFNAAKARLDALKTLQEKINAGDGEYYKNVDGVRKIATNTGGATFAYVPALAYENTLRNFTGIINNDQARAYVALTASLEAVAPGIWSIGYGSTPDPTDVYITSISTSGGDGKAVKGSPTGGTCYTHNSLYANGFSIEPLNDRDCIRVGSMEAGNFPDLTTRPNKDELLWAVATLKEQNVPAATLTASEAYQNALLNLDGWDALGCTIETPKAEQQAVIDAALAALKAAFPDYDLDRYPASPEAKAVIKLINAIGDVTRDSKTAIEAAEAAYAALTAEQKAEVANYATLTKARADYDKLMNLVASEPGTALTGVLNWLQNHVTAPVVGSTEGEWAVLAMARGGVFTDAAKTAYLEKLDAAMTAGNVLSKYTDYERVTLALSSLGVDATAYGDPAADLTAPYATYTAMSSRSPENQTLMADIYALLALNAKPYATGDREQYVSGILAAEFSGGGWNHAVGSAKADVDTTGMAIQALAPYYGTNASVKAAVDRALAWLKTQQDEYTGGFSPFGRPNTEANAQVVTALCALGIDPAGTDWTVSGKNPLSALTLWWNKDEGWFGHDKATFDQMATEQAAYALVAWMRFSMNRNALYDMRDVFAAEAAEQDLAALKTKLAGLSWTLLQADAETSAAVKTAVERKASAGILSGATATVTITDFNAAVAGTEASPNGTNGSYTATIKLEKGEGDEKAEETLTVSGTITATKYKKPSDNQEKITVTFRLVGAEQAAQDVDLSQNTYLPKYVTWIPTTTYTIDANRTMYDLYTMATAAAGVESVGADSNYVKTVTAPASLGGYDLSEFSNGTYSGWMYTVNGKHPGVGLKAYVFADDESVTNAGSATVVWHYINDYRYECSDWYGGSLGNADVWDGWLKATDSTGGSGGGAAAGEVKKDEKDSASGNTTNDSNTITADDGSTVTTETEKTVETKENDDGSVTEVVTETTKTTVTAPDGSVSTTETAVETETTTNSVKNADGTVTETTGTVEKVTETVTAADGTTQTTVTETEENKQLNTTTSADGKVSGTGTYSATSTVTVDGKKTTAVTEGTVAVSTDDKGTVSEVTNAKTTTTAPDGTKTETVVVITEAEMANGTTGKVVADEAGNTISAEASVSQAALEAAAKSGEPIEIPVTVNAASGATVSISLEGAGEGSKLWVEIGTTDTAPGNVAYLKLADGVTKLLTTCKTGSVIVPVTGDCEVIVKDNSKSFSDVDGASWYGDSVTFVTARSIFNGNGDGTFAPTATMNRAMAAQILYNLDGSAKAGDGSRFSDVSGGDWFNGAVGWASGLGVITGYNGAYAPLDAVTRQDLVTILYRYAKQAGYNVSAGSVDLTAYADGAEVASYAAEAMRWAIAVGLVKGYEDNTLRPTATATRAEVAAIMQRMVQSAVK